MGALSLSSRPGIFHPLDAFMGFGRFLAAKLFLFLFLFFLLGLHFLQRLKQFLKNATSIQVPLVVVVAPKLLRIKKNLMSPSEGKKFLQMVESVLKILNSMELRPL